MNSPEYHIIKTTWAEDQQTLRQLRSAVFMQEQAVPEADEWDGKDDDAVHFLVRLHSGDPIATARVLDESDIPGQVLYHIGRVAVIKDHRSRGIGRQLMLTVMAWCRQQHAAAQLYLHAQTARQNFYQRLGFVAQGTEFMDAGIPHIAMYFSTTENEHTTGD